MTDALAEVSTFVLSSHDILFLEISIFTCTKADRKHVRIERGVKVNKCCEFILFYLYVISRYLSSSPERHA